MRTFSLPQCILVLAIPSEVTAYWPDVELITAAPHLRARDDLPPWANDPSCLPYSNLLGSCGSKVGIGSTTETGSRYTAQLSSLLTCLCYTTSSSIITSYDDVLGTCLSYLQTKSPSVFSSLVGTLVFRSSTYTRPCAEAASVASVQSFVTDRRVTACGELTSISHSCVSATPNWIALPLSSQASCACYISSGSAWAPQVFDGYLSSCLDYYQTYNTQIYSSLSYLPRSLCASIGNVRGASTATGSEASATIPTRTSTSPSAALTTSQPRATATANGGSRQIRCCDWLLVLFVAVVLVVSAPNF